MQFEMAHASVHNGTSLPVFPVLMPADWQHAPTQIVQSLFRGTDLPAVPLVTPVSFIGDPDAGVFQRINFRHEYLAARGWTEAEFYLEAFANIARRPATWEHSFVEAVLESTGSFLSAEKILDTEFLRAAGRMLGTPSLVVAIPERGHLYAGAMHDVHLGAFAATVRTQFQRAGAQRIAPWLFQVRDGKLAAILELM